MSKIKILIVEDEAIVAADLAGKLERLGYEVVGTAAGGEEAVGLARRLWPDLVLMDIWLQGSMDGIDAAEAIRRQHDIPVIYLTALSDAATLARAKLTGAIGYILKPFEERDLATQIDMGLYRHQSDRQIREQRELLRVTLASIGDAVIATDAHGRITFLNPVAESLTGWKAEEASIEPVQVVFRIVNEETGQPIEEPVARVLRERRAVTLANHAALVTKDGRVVPVEDSAAPILDAAGQVIGTVLVFHDVTEKRHAQEALRASEERFRRYFELGLIGMAITSPTKGIIEVNDELCSILGYERGELLKKTWGELTHPDDLAADVDQFNRVMAGEIEGYPMDKRCIRKDGQVIDATISVRALRRADGSVDCFVALVQDITARKRAEEALRESEERYRNLVRFAPAAIYEMDLHGTKFLSVNDVLCDILNYPRNELLAMKPSDLLDEESSTLFKERINKKLAGEKIDETVEYRIKRKDGEWIHTIVNVRSCTYTDDKPSRVVVIGYDITERKRLEEALRQNEKRYRMLVKHAPAGIYEIDFTTGCFTEVNDVMCQILGYTREELLAMTAFDVLDDEGRARFASRIRMGRSGDPPEEAAEYRVRTKDGRLIWALVNVTFHWSEGNIVGATVVAHDITDRKRAEEEVARSRDELEVRVQERTSELARANEMLRGLSSRLLSAHEEERKRVAAEIHDTIGSCLSAVKFRVESAVRKIGETSHGTPESLTAIIPVVQESIDECRRIQMDLRPSMLDDLGLLPTLSWLCRRFQEIYSGIRVDQEFGSGEEEIEEALKIIMYRVTQEAMNNIAKHSGANLVRLSVGKVDGGIELSIRDNGRGFDPGKALAVKSTARGLGLSSMRERTELSGGAFSIESADGRGTTIRASWPLQHQHI